MRMPGSSIPVRQTPIDGSTNIWWKFNEAASPVLNYGASGTLSLTSSGSLSFGTTGLFDNSVSFNTGSLGTASTSTGEPAGNSLTISAWVWPTDYSTYGSILAKNYRSDNAWSSPYSSLGIALSNANDGTWTASMAVSGLLYQPSHGSQYKLPARQWSLLAMTYDGANMRCYINGTLASTTPIVGSCDFGTHGAWAVGNITATGAPFFGTIGDIRVESTVRSKQYLVDMYRYALNLR